MSETRFVVVDRPSTQAVRVIEARYVLVEHEHVVESIPIEVTRFVVVSSRREVITVERERFVVVNDGRTAAAGAQTITARAAESLGGHRVVTLNADREVEYADSSEDVYGRVVGVTTGSVSAGDVATVRTAGRLDEPSWSWTPGATLYLGLDGILSEVAPENGVFQQIGYAIDQTSIFINITNAIER